MKNLLLITLSILSLIFGGCSKGKKEVNLPEPPKDLAYESIVLIDGPLAGYIEAVPGKYSFEIKKSEYDGYEGFIKVKFKFLKTIDVKAGQGYNNYGPTIHGEVLSADGVPLDFRLSEFTSTDLARNLKTGSGENWLTLRLNQQGLASTSEEAQAMLDMFSKGTKITFHSEIEEEKFDDSPKESEAKNDESSSQNNLQEGNCDEYLEGYEKFMEKYIKILKKYKENPSDPAILSEYTTMMTETQTWSTKVSGCSSDPAFAAKVAAIQLKIAQAAQ